LLEYFVFGFGCIYRMGGYVKFQGAGEQAAR
jgi:hypothetical protein